MLGILGNRMPGKPRTRRGAGWQEARSGHHTGRYHTTVLRTRSRKDTPNLAEPPQDALLFFTGHVQLSLGLLPGPGAPQNSPTPFFQYTTDTLLRKNNCVLIHCC
ncbi:unnamed protein product [Rangifer tarandus platyrhynchus]|uniref:Uncharacterized protein n=2 Tax=Rangifer tarandus platyrhynchus TaxID=3082113 RepID=A0ACB0FGD3_RANTA|nr:unnamed protein product [Rangifer tarandus platyrhynchus]CAI9712127.1 unnamed protein product [Rangifer tarandus platyrhynchus]